MHLVGVSELRESEFIAKTRFWLVVGKLPGSAAICCNLPWRVFLDPKRKTSKLPLDLPMDVPCYQTCREFAGKFEVFFPGLRTDSGSVAWMDSRIVSRTLCARWSRRGGVWWDS